MKKTNYERNVQINENLNGVRKRNEHTHKYLTDINIIHHRTKLLQNNYNTQLIFPFTAVAIRLS